MEYEEYEQYEETLPVRGNPTEYTLKVDNKSQRETLLLWTTNFKQDQGTA
jgi:hypothetical protein